MNTPNSKTRALAIAAAMIAAPLPAHAAVTIDFDASNPGWLGFMNVFNLPSDGGGYVFGSDWGVPDLVASLNTGANTVTLSPNTIGDPDPFWYQGGGGPGALGNKIMEANLYLQNTGGLAGESITFRFEVLANTLTSAHQVKAFIRDFAPDFSSVVETAVDLTAAGDYSLNLDAINDPNRHVQVGFQMRGENVWATDVAPFGNMVIGAIPEPSAALLGVLGLSGLLLRRRK